MMRLLALAPVLVLTSTWMLVLGVLLLSQDLLRRSRLSSLHVAPLDYAFLECYWLSAASIEAAFDSQSRMAIDAKSTSSWMLLHS